MQSKRRILLAPGLRGTLADILAWCDAIAIRFFALNGILASTYYCLFSRRFDREHLVVLRGRIEYRRSLMRLRRSSTLMRRNIHRLEKGLIMRPRRAIFGEGFILETVREHIRARQVEGFSAEELSWATDVLNEYFDAVADSEAVNEAKAEYLNSGAVLRDEKKCLGRKSAPYSLGSLPGPKVSFDDLFSLFMRRRSVRWYQDKSVPMDLIRKTVNAATLAPSACNRQPFRFIVSNCAASASVIAACAGGTAGFSGNIPAIVVVVGDLSAYSKVRDRHLIYIDASLASMQLMLAAETLGLSTCPINWPDVDRSERQIQRLLNLPPYERVVMLIGIGYGDPTGQIPFSQKKGDSLLMDEFKS